MFVSTNPELNEIEQEIAGIQLDLHSNTSTILIKPQEMKVKIELYISDLNQIEHKLQFLKKSVGETNSKKINELEKKISVLRNQIELNLKILKSK